MPISVWLPREPLHFFGPPQALIRITPVKAIISKSLKVDLACLFIVISERKNHTYYCVQTEYLKNAVWGFMQICISFVNRIEHSLFYIIAGPDYGIAENRNGLFAVIPT